MNQRAEKKQISYDSVSWLLPPVLILLVQQMFWRTPLGAVLQGIVLGLLTSLVALGIVLIYRSNRVLNFAQGELGLLPTILSVMLIVESGFPVPGRTSVGIIGSDYSWNIIRISRHSKVYTKPPTCTHCSNHRTGTSPHHVRITYA